MYRQNVEQMIVIQERNFDDLTYHRELMADILFIICKWQLIYTHKVDLSTFPSRLGTMEVLYETHITKLFSPEIKVARLMKMIKQDIELPERTLDKIEINKFLRENKKDEFADLIVENIADTQISNVEKKKKKRKNKDSPARVITLFDLIEVL